MSYPNEQIYQLLDESLPILKAENLLDDKTLEGIGEFCTFFSTRTLVQWQEHYVQLFDYSRGASLYLFEHLHGDSKDRGQAMVDLINIYEEAGLTIDKSELPDYLPLFLEFLSLSTPEKAASYLAEVVDIVGVIHPKLAAKDNPFRHLLYAVIKLSAREPDEKKITMISSMMPDISLDEAYEEKPVTFGCEYSPEYKQETSPS